MTSNKMEHLACFVGGNLMLGAHTIEEGEVDARWRQWGEALTHTCHEMYARTSARHLLFRFVVRYAGSEASACFRGVLGGVQCFPSV